MSILSKLTAMPNRIEIAQQFLLASGADGIDVTEFKKALSPPSLSTMDPDEEGSSIADDVVAVLRQLGFAEIDSSNNKVRSLLAVQGGNATARWKPIDELANALLEPERCRKSQQEGFPLALAWFLCQETGLPLRKGENPIQQVQRQLDGLTLDIGNAARADNLLYWARYLGFASWLGDDQGVIPDPTIAIRRSLPKVFGEVREFALSEFIDRLGLRCSVLESGEFRNELESHLQSDYRRPEGSLSESTSFALLRLDKAGIISLEKLADAPGMLLRVGSMESAKSHIRYLR